MVDLVVPVSAPGATTAATQLRSVAGAAAAVTSEATKVSSATQRYGAAIRNKTAALEGAGRSFGQNAKQAGLLGAKLATLSALTGGVGGKFAALGGLAGALGPLGLAIGGISLGMGLLEERAKKAEDRIKRIGELKEGLASATEKQNGLVDQIASETETAGRTPGLRAAIAGGADFKQIGKTINATTSNEDAVKIESLLASADLSDAQRKEFRRGSALIGKVGGDRVKTVENLIQQSSDDKTRGDTGRGVLGANKGISTPLDRLLDAGGFDPGSEAGQKLAQNFFNPQLGALDQAQQADVERRRGQLGSALDPRGLDAVAEVTARQVPVIEANTKGIADLNKTMEGMRDELKKLNKESAKSTVLVGVTDY